MRYSAMEPMDREEVNRIAMQVANEIYLMTYLITPVKTGNLRNNSLQMKDNGVDIEIFYDDFIAPYINKSPKLAEKLDNISGFINNMYSYFTGAVQTSQIFSIPDYRDYISPHEMLHKDDYLRARGLIE